MYYLPDAVSSSSRISPPPLTFPAALGGKCCSYPHFMDEETEAQRNEGTCLRSLGTEAAGPGLGSQARPGAVIGVPFITEAPASLFTLIVFHSSTTGRTCHLPRALSLIPASSLGINWGLSSPASCTRRGVWAGCRAEGPSLAARPGPLPWSALGWEVFTPGLT